MKKIIVFFLSLLFCIISINAQSDFKEKLDRSEHLLDGKSFTYQYQSGAAIAISFDNKKLTYQWIAGRNAGKPKKTFPYESRKLNEGVYYVNWHEIELENFITLVFNFNNNTCASSVIVRYGSEKPITAFEGGIIEHVKNK